jgi:hypothetical protein
MRDTRKKRLHLAFFMPLVRITPSGLQALK